MKVISVLLVMLAGAWSGMGDARALFDESVEREQSQQPTSQVPTLGRPTRPDDPAPLLDFAAYFSGSWHFTWDFPESPLGPAGTLTGTTVFKTIDESTFEAVSTATGDGGAVTIREIISYQRDKQTISREVTDSRGFAYKQAGTVAGDLGGQFTIRLESAPFVYNGQSIRLRNVQRLLSPLNYRTLTTIAVSDGPFTNYGNPWWKKDTSEALPQTDESVAGALAVVLPRSAGRTAPAPVLEKLIQPVRLWASELSSR